MKYLSFQLNGRLVTSPVLRSRAGRSSVLARTAAALMVLVIAAPFAAFASGSPGVWWKNAVIYEIYPRSFQDSDADGTGDLNGIASRLDYLEDLGIDAIWIAPTFPSPDVDFGYDISDYLSVDPKFGTLADMDRLIGAAKQHHIRILLDMVLNHTSDRHPWFVAAAASRTSPRHDWYVWNDGIPGTGPRAHEGHLPPNNWVSLFGGSAWEWVPAVHQYYYHMFYRQQPDLNWRNPEVEKAMFGAMRFWLDRGIAGFRLDAIPTLFEDPLLRNERELGGVNDQGDPKLDDSLTNNLPEVHDVIRRMRAMVNGYTDNRVLIGETYMPKTSDLDAWYGGARHDELNFAMDMLFGFHGDHDRLDVASFRAHLEEAQSEVHGSPPLFVFDNHDNVRSIDRYGDGTHDEQINRLLGSVLLTSRAAALVYYGEEIGMRTTTPTRREDVKDPIGVTGWPMQKGRDGERTPMQWSAVPHAGFSNSANTWLPIPQNYLSINVATEAKDPRSTLQWYKQLIHLRRSDAALAHGRMTMLDTSNTHVLSYLRTAGPGRTVVVALNFTAEPQAISLDLPASAGVKPAAHTLLTDAPALQNADSVRDLMLPPFSTWIASVK
jgi:alpha-glucosidase